MTFRPVRNLPLTPFQTAFRILGAHSADTQAVMPRKQNYAKLAVLFSVPQNGASIPNGLWPIHTD